MALAGVIAQQVAKAAAGGGAPALSIDAWRQLFVDQKALEKKIGRANFRILMRGGAYIRSDARKSIRKVKKPTTHSKPGSPPKSHDPQGRYRKIFYAYDRQSKSVVVGHLSYFGQTEPLPGIHEYGGRGMIKVQNRGRWGGKVSPKQKRAFKRKYGKSGEPVGRVRKRYRRVPYYFPPRPATQPARDKNQPKIVQMWKDAVY